MNWILKDSDKIEFHTKLSIVLKPIEAELKDMNWLITDFDYLPLSKEDLPIDLNHDYFVLSFKDFQRLIHADMQIIWGVLLGIPSTFLIEVDKDNLPYAEFNNLVWKDGNIQHPNAQIEIICFDSSCTIVKFRDRHLSNKFKVCFEEAIELEKFSNNSYPDYL